METSKGVIVITSREKNKPPVFVNLYLSAAWMPVFPIYENGFGEGPAFPGLAVRAGIISSSLLPFDAGLELTASWNRLDSANTLSAELNFAAKADLPHDAMALFFRIGLGLFLPLDSEMPRSFFGVFYTNIGVSFRWLIRESLYLETGIDYPHLFTEIESGGIKPWICIGISN